MIIMTDNMDNLVDDFAAASLSENTAGSSSFESQATHVPLSFKLPDLAEYKDYIPRRIPRYLFRVSSKASSGDTSESWVKSPAAIKYETTPGKLTSILTMSRETKPARMLYKHLRWIPFGENESADNLMSWTSSILFVLVYIYRHHVYNKQPWGDIHLCIVDTTKFPKATFICDLDLLHHFEDEDEDKSLVGFRHLRNSRYYFGEYLTQGALRVSEKCKLVDAWNLMDAGLLKTHVPDTIKKMREGFEKRPKELAEPVLVLRNALLNFTATSLNDERLKAIVKVADVFGRALRLPVALHLVSMLQYSDVPERLLQGFDMFSIAITEEEWEECNPLKTVIVTHIQLREVEELKKNTEQLWRLFPYAKLQENLQQTVASLEASKKRTLQMASNNQDRAAFWNATTEAIRIMISLSKEILHELQFE